jgi:hypothetical protein
MPSEKRRDDTWLSDAQLARCARADEAEFSPSPIPAQIVSNGEYLPMAQTEEQKRVQARTMELADGAAKKLGMSRRKFLAGTGGMAAALLAMNEVYGHFFDVRPLEMFESEAFAESGVPRNLFVFDDQLHMVRHSNVTTNRALRALAQGPTTPRAEFPWNPFNPPPGLLDELGDVWSNWNPALINDQMGPDIYQLANFIKALYFDSQVTVGLLSNITGFLPVFVEGIPPTSIADARTFEVLTADQTAAVRDFVNHIAGGAKRLLAHGLMYVGDANLFDIQRQIDQNKPDSWKGYTVSLAAKQLTDAAGDPMRAWRLDDEQVAYKTFELIAKYQTILRKERPGFGNICVHKGFAPTDEDTPENGNPEDIPKAARDWPNFNFIIYHSCIKPILFYNPEPLQNLLSSQPTLREGVPDIRWTTRFAQLARDLPNVYAELGSTFASTVITFPTVWAHLIGQLMKFMGPRRIVFGSDSLWYGAPQWQLEAFWRFQIPEALRKRWGYPGLSSGDKKRMLGMNSAQLYRLPLGSRRPVPPNYEELVPDELKTLLEFPGFASDNLSRLKERYLAEGPVPDHTRYGWIRTMV